MEDPRAVFLSMQSKLTGRMLKIGAHDVRPGPVLANVARWLFQQQAEQIARAHGRYEPKRRRPKKADNGLGVQLSVKHRIEAFINLSLKCHEQCDQCPQGAAYENARADSPVSEHA